MLGLCLGLQCMVIEVARDLAGIEKAGSTEFDPECPDPVIATMADQQDVVAGERDMGGTMRLGLWPTALTKGSQAAQAYGDEPATERHRHRYEVNNAYRPQLEAAGLVFSGTSPDGHLVEIAELPEEVHPFFVGTQAHPEFRSRPTRAHPLFRAFVAAAVRHSDEPRGCRWAGVPASSGLRTTTRSRTAEAVFEGRIISVRKDQVTMPGDTTSQRDVVVHPGAVGVVALDEQGRVLLVNQYRHPVRRRLDELPAGLLDKPGEPALEAAQRELVEEAGLAAGTWHVLVDALTSPGMTDEAIRIFLARDVRTVDRDVQEHEEADMTTAWVDLDEAVRRVLAGEIENAMAAVGILAADRARATASPACAPPTRPGRARRPPT